MACHCLALQVKLFLLLKALWIHFNCWRRKFSEGTTTICVHVKCARTHSMTTCVTCFWVTTTWVLAAVISEQTLSQVACDSCKGTWCADHCVRNRVNVLSSWLTAHSERKMFFYTQKHLWNIRWDNELIPLSNLHPFPTV